MNKIRLLLAEDEVALAHIVRESLEEQNFEVTLCFDGEHTLKKYHESKPDILALDVMMPKMDGFDLAKKIRETDQTIPIIFLTARSQPKDVVAGFDRVEVVYTNERDVVAHFPDICLSRTGGDAPSGRGH